MRFMSEIGTAPAEKRGSEAAAVAVAAPTAALLAERERAEAAAAPRAKTGGGGAAASRPSARVRKEEEVPAASLRPMPRIKAPTTTPSVGAAAPPPVAQSAASAAAAASAASAADPAGAGTKRPPSPSLHDQVLAAITRHAVEQRGLAATFERHGLEWDASAAAKMCQKAARQISESISARGETSYSLLGADAQPNVQRIAAVDRYLAKLVAKRATSAQQK